MGTFLCYHTVDPDFRSRLSVAPDRFAAQAAWLARHRRVVDMATALTLVGRRGTLPRGTVALTFDDGLAGLYPHALPVLRRLGLPATVFVVADSLTGAHPDVDWIDGTPPGVLSTLTVDQVREFAAEGIQIGSHSSRHLDLTTLGGQECERDLRHSREVLEEVLGQAVTTLAYPRGRHDAVVRRAARRAGFTHAFSLPEGPEPVGPHAIPRIGVYAHNDLRTLRTKTSGAYLHARTSRAWSGARVVTDTLRPVRRAVGAQAHDAGRESADPAAPAVAHVMSRFPKISETFVLDEILELRRQGLRVEVYPLLRERQPVAHPEAAAVAETARYQPFLSPAIVASHLRFLGRDPARYLGTVRDVLAGTAGSRNFLVGALGILPKAVHMAGLMEQEGITHVHCHFATHPAVAGMVVQRLTGIPFSFVAHGSDLHVDQHMLGTKVAEAAFVVAISEYNRRVILEAADPAHHDRVHVVHCGVDTGRFRPPPDDGDSTGAPTLVCVGTLHAVKGQHVLVEACARLRADGVPFRAVLVGDGPDAQALAARIRALGLVDQVVLAGPLPRDEVIARLGAADLVVAPSVPTREGKREGIPVALMEAMAMGRPVVASRLSGIPELVEDGRSGLLVDPGDVRGLAAAISALLADPARRRRMGAVGRARVVEEFDLARSVATLRRLVEQSAAVPAALAS